MPGQLPPLVQAVQLDKRYVDGPSIVQVLTGLDVEVEAGERIAIVGESGVGKSTLLHLLGALDQPTGGRILFEGVDVFARSEAELAVFRNREIGFVFQFHHLLGDFTALENVMLPSLIARQPFAATRARATELLERVGLRERLAHRPGQLSGGDQQRVAVPRAARAEPSIAGVGVAGNLRVEEDAIRVHLRSQPGQPFDQDTIDRDIRAVYAMGFFDQVDADVTRLPENRVEVVFRVKERPLVRAVKIEGNKKVKREELEGALKIRAHTILDPEKARQGLEAGKKLYVEKGYFAAALTYSTERVGENEVDVLYKVEEHEPVKVVEVGFEGNKAFSARKLRGVMQTREKWLFGFITGAGVLNKEVLRTDVERLTAWYYDHGYVTVRVDEPRVERRDAGLHATGKIDEGDQYRVGAVGVAGENTPADTKPLLQGLAITPGEVFKASALREDTQKLTERLSEDGYAFASIEPET